MVGTRDRLVHPIGSELGPCSLAEQVEGPELGSPSWKLTQVSPLPRAPCSVPAENATFNSSSEAERKTQRFYLSCLQVERIQELGARPLRDLIDKAGALGSRRQGAREGRWKGTPPGALWGGP